MPSRLFPSKFAPIRSYKLFILLAFVDTVTNYITENAYTNIQKQKLAQQHRLNSGDGALTLIHMVMVIYACISVCACSCRVSDTASTSNSVTCQLTLIKVSYFHPLFKLIYSYLERALKELNKMKECFGSNALEVGALFAFVARIFSIHGLCLTFLF